MKDEEGGDPCAKLVVGEMAFWVPAHEAASSWVRVRLAALKGLGGLRDILEAAWRQAATDQLLEAHPELGPGRHSDSA
ncbi:hypothetical protein [Streptomyces sp. NPDC001828]|uniref:hypothetical protein n=1 Tax=Streptomyces sp. NPDC001828 TaxID=3364615 RepID=UPI0036A54E03